MKYILLFLLLSPCCLKAQTDTARITSRSSNPQGTVWLTTTDPRVTLEYVRTDTVPATFVLADTVNVPQNKVRGTLIFKGWVVRDNGKDIAYLLPNKTALRYKIEFYTTNNKK